MTKYKQLVLNYIKSPRKVASKLMMLTASLWPDNIYLRLLYYLKIGRKLNLARPESFTEKINWLKLNDIHPEYTKLVDKYEVKAFVKEKLGTDDIIIKTLGVYDSFGDIDFSKLPLKFVLKTTNGGGNTSVVICKDKDKLNLNRTRKKLRLKNSKALYKWSREYPYYTIMPRIIAEEYIDAPGNELSDYKIFCFDGVPKFLFVGTERQKIGEEVKFDFYDLEFNHLTLRNGHDNSQVPIEKPLNFEFMLEIASKLSKGIPHVRVDLYNVNGKIYFGEMTFFHFGGFVPFEPDYWDYKFGEYLSLPEIR